MVEFLKERGFAYQHVFKATDGGGQIEVSYPNSLEEAKEFTETYKLQAYTDNNIF